MQPQTQTNPIEIKISTVVAIAVILHDADLTVLGGALKKMTANSSDYYSEECAVIDVSNIDCAALDWAALIALFKSSGFHPVAVRHAPEECEEQISALGLTIDLGRSSEKPIPQPTATKPDVCAVNNAPLEGVAKCSEGTRFGPRSGPVQEYDRSTAGSKIGPSEHFATPSLPPMVIDTPVRGGQRIYARGKDLIITAVVNSGAEIIADGNIHIYAPLRGRALAGASGNTGARIFTTSLEAELVSIAGIYRTFEHGFPSLTPQRPIQISLNGDKIEVVSIQSHS